MILVTGGAGYIGSHTCVELINKGYEVVVVDNLSNSKEISLDRVKQITGKRPIFIKADVRDYQAMDNIFSTYNIDCVIHFAGFKAVGESVAQPMKYYDNNINSTLVLCKVMQEHNVNNLVFSSSATVYSGNNEMPLKETSTTGNCTNPYGWTKYMIEQILEGLCVSNPKMSVVLLRYFNPIGAHESGLMGEDPQGIPNNLMPYISQVAVGKLKQLTVYGDDYDTHDGTGVRDYIHVVDLAKAHLCAVEFTYKNTGCEVFNVGTGTGYSVLDIIKAFEKTTGQKVPYVIGPRRPGDLATVYSDATKAYEVLGFKTSFDIEKMCKDAWNWQKNNPKGYDY